MGSEKRHPEKINETQQRKRPQKSRMAAIPPSCAEGSPPIPHAAKSAAAAQVQVARRCGNPPVQRTPAGSRTRRSSRDAQRCTSSLPPKTHIIRDELWGRTREKRRLLIRRLWWAAVVVEGGIFGLSELSFFNFQVSRWISLSPSARSGLRSFSTRTRRRDCSWRPLIGRAAPFQPCSTAPPAVSDRPHPHTVQVVKRQGWGRRFRGSPWALPGLSQDAEYFPLLQPWFNKMMCSV